MMESWLTCRVWYLGDQIKVMMVMESWLTCRVWYLGDQITVMMESWLMAQVSLGVLDIVLDDPH